MEEQVTVRLPADLGRALRAAARRTQRKSSEIVRMALREYLSAPGSRAARPADRVAALIGSLETGVPDLAAKHREYLVETLRRGR